MENKQGATKGIIIVVITILIMIVIFLISNAIDKGLKNNEGKTMNASLGDFVLVNEIQTSEVHYIDKSLLNIPLSVPYKVLPSNATNKDVDVISSDSSIVRVNDDNTITALSTGEVTLTLVADDGSSTTASLKIVIE